MTDDPRLSQLLRTALPSVEVPEPSRDLWPDIVHRAGTRERFSVADVGVAAIVAIALLLFPRWFWFLAYHL
jgi:uncharacterized membrane protein YdbT with pleckstrin-like domain